jgi:hypothetical protein
MLMPPRLTSQSKGSPIMTRASVKKLCTSIVLCWAVVCAFAAAQTASSPKPVINRKAVLGAATRSYYNLRNQGLVSFQCEITPDWNLLLQDQRKQNPAAADSAIGILNQLHFIVNLAADDSVKITHNELTGQNPQIMSALAQIYDGMEQMTSGFFDNWKLFMVNTPFPAVDSDYQLEDLGQRYRLTYKESGSDVTTSMGHDYQITNLQVTAKDYDSAIQPTFSNDGSGYILSSYDATYTSQNAAEKTVLTVNMDYQQVRGLQLTRTLSLSGTYGGTPFAVKLTFSNYQVTKK